MKKNSEKLRSSDEKEECDSSSKTKPRFTSNEKTSTKEGSLSGAKRSSNDVLARSSTRSKASPAEMLDAPDLEEVNINGGKEGDYDDGMSSENNRKQRENVAEEDDLLERYPSVFNVSGMNRNQRKKIPEAGRLSKEEKRKYRRKGNPYRFGRKSARVQGKKTWFQV